MENIQLSLFGRTYPELFQVTTERILEPCLKKSQTPIFQCLQVANGQPQEWLEGGEVDTAWRILDAQYWGVPQRRKRIYLIGDFGGQRAGEILFNRYREVQNADGTVTHEAVEGEVVQEGTPQNAQNFNDLEERVLSAGLIANLAMLKLGAAESRIKGLQGEIVEATLTNTKSYPFNNSKKTLALTTPRGNLDYTVNVEAEAKDAGGVGEIRITDKQLNGFKIEYTGAAKEVTVKCTVQGGYA